MHINTDSQINAQTCLSCQNHFSILSISFDPPHPIHF